MTESPAFAGQFDTFFGPKPPARLGVAVSGGSDSLALLHLLHDWGRVGLVAVTVDHGLRPGSAGEAAHVADICARMGLPHETLEWRGWDGRGNLQDEARRTRYSLMADWARRQGIAEVALGHTRDDQAETFLMRLAREAGVDGLSGMATRIQRNGVTFCRPLLGVGRGELRDELTRRRIKWIDDPTNADEGYDRVRMRRALATLAELGLTAKAIAASAAHLQDARAALSEAARLFVLEKVRDGGGDLIFDRALLNRQPAEIRRRLVAGALRWVASEEYPPRREPLADLDKAILDVRNATLHGCRVLVSDMTVRITREHEAVAGTVGPTDAPWDGRWTLAGPHAPGLQVRALGEAVALCPGWRETRLPRATLLASPAIWSGTTLVAAPLAGLTNGWIAKVPGKAEFADALIAH